MIKKNVIIVSFDYSSFYAKNQLENIPLQPPKIHRGLLNIYTYTIKYLSE